MDLWCSGSLQAARLPTDCVPENALTIVSRIVAGKAIRGRDTIENSFLQAHRSVVNCNERGRRIFGWDQRETMENCAAVYVAKQCAFRRPKIETILGQANPFRLSDCVQSCEISLPYTVTRGACLRTDPKRRWHLDTSGSRSIRSSYLFERLRQ